MPRPIRWSLGLAPVLVRAGAGPGDPVSYDNTNFFQNLITAANPR